MRTKKARGRVVVGAALLVLSGCAGSMQGLFPEAPSLETRCRIGASQTSVLVTEWPAAEKANLEGLLAGGAVGVAFSGCELRVVPQCQLGGSYGWQRTTPASETIEIENEADLFARLPIGAAALSGELRRSGRLAVTTTVSGQRRLGGMTGADVPNQPACTEVTHVVSALSLGAFTLSAGASLSGSARVEVSGVGAGGSSSNQTRVVRSAGDAARCSASTAEAPAPDCASPVQVFLSPVPGRAAEPPPPGTVQVDFVSASADDRWDVYVDDQATCTTPCARFVDPSRPLVLRTREDRPTTLRIDRLETGLGPLQVSAAPTAKGALSTGIVFTTLGGLAAATGIVLTSVGCSMTDELPGMCTAGLISLVAGSAVTTGSIMLMLDARARIGVRPVFSVGRSSSWQASLVADLARL